MQYLQLYVGSNNYQHAKALVAQRHSVTLLRVQHSVFLTKYCFFNLFFEKKSIYNILHDGFALN